MIKDFYSKQERKVIYTSEGVESVHLSLMIKFSKDDFAKVVRKVAGDLTTEDLKDVKNISIVLEASD